ncbi:hypothetical protein [Gemmatimonas sp.]|uniref:hypothetical protein n=1 Tax=Gemmatimonas sp. TaxID=1962908 RepID=UPI00333F8943
MRLRFIPWVPYGVALGLLALSPSASAQAQAKAPAAAKGQAAAGTISGSYAGTATVPLGDSTLVVPVSYQFTGTAPAITGMAIVPGQGTGAISNVVRDGKKLRFRVTAAENRMLEHDGVIAADGSIEGFVNLDNKPVAKFKIAPGTLPATKAAPKPAGAVKPKGA